ncbi:TfoX/Sxy family protein [Moraxella bovis]|uniref:TfoX/Sxy family protein n=1 Tax=Moraxella bovis TaxID=476 RepID=UPI0015F198DB|nr:TfoX/Sxy family protein [Moraxella bovis]
MQNGQLWFRVRHVFIIFITHHDRIQRIYRLYLRPISPAPITVKRMFEVGCLFKHGKMFGIVADDTLYLKADDDNRQVFIKFLCKLKINPYKHWV